MKKLIIFVLLVCLSTSYAMAVDVNLSELTYDDLVALYDKCQYEIIKRNTDRVITIPVGVWKIGDDLPAGHWSITASANSLFGWGSISYCDVLDASGKKPDTKKSSFYYGTNVKNISSDAKVESTTIDLDLKENTYIVIENGALDFTPYTGKQSISIGNSTITENTDALMVVNEESQPIESGDYTYSILSDGSAIIEKYHGYDFDIQIPSTIDGIRVSSIGDSAYSFQDAGSISIPEGITSIGSRAFANNKYLSSVILPSTLVSIGTNPFASCENLSSISISPSNEYFAIIDGVLFEKATRKLICYPLKLYNSIYSIPEGINTIGAYSFYSASYIEVKIPSTVTTIEDEAFSFSKIETTIPRTVTNLGANPFNNCSSYKIKVADDHPTLIIIDDCLYDKKQKKIISFGSSSLPVGVEIIGSKSYAFDWGIYQIELPDTVKVIEDEAFDYCPEFKSILIPDSVISIGDNAFKDCDHLAARVYSGSYAEKYCQENGLPYELIDNDLSWLQ